MFDFYYSLWLWSWPWFAIPHPGSSLVWSFLHLPIYHIMLLTQPPLLGSQFLLLPNTCKLISELGKTFLLKNRVMILLFCCDLFSQHSEFYYLSLTAANVAINLLSQRFSSRLELCKFYLKLYLNKSTWNNMLSYPPLTEKTCLQNT